LQKLQVSSTKIITLVAKNLAKVGFKFIHEGEAEECSKCPLRKVCIEKLSKKRIYEVVRVRRRRHQCPVHGEVVVVEVTYSSIDAVIERKYAIEGIIVKYNPIDCEENCIYRRLCQPEGLIKGDKVKIEKLLGDIDCPRGLRLVKAQLYPLIT